MNLDPNSVIFYYLIYESWSILYEFRLRLFFLNISICLISYYISLSNLIKVQIVLWNSFNSLWIWPLFSTIFLNSWLIFKIGGLGNYFDAYLCVFNDLADLLHHKTYQQEAWRKAIEEEIASIKRIICVCQWRLQKHKSPLVWNGYSR